MAYTVARPKLTYAEKAYLPAIMTGLGITLRHFLEILSGKKKVTMQYPEESRWRKVEKYPKEFEIDMIRCIYCGLCEEVCPEQAIFLLKDYAITGLSRQEMVHNKEKLYELGGVMTGLVHKWNEKK